MSDSVWPHRRQPTRLPRPWDSPGKNTGVGCHFLLQCMKGKSESEVAQLCPTLSDPMDCSPPGSSVHGIFQARVLEWGAIALSGEDPLEEGIATHSIILAWRIPWTEEPGGLQSRVTESESNWSKLAPAAACQSMWILKCPNVSIFNSLLQKKREDF